MLAAAVIRLVLLFMVISLISVVGVERRTAPTESLVISSFSVEQFAARNWTSNVQKYIEHEQFRLKVISNFSDHKDEVPFVKRRLAEFKAIYKSMTKNSTNLKFQSSLRENHPTTVLAAVRNFLAHWENKLANTTIYGQRLREFLEANKTRPLPTRRDLNLIGTALAVVQATYNLSIGHLLKGKVLGSQGEPLTPADCYDIGKTVLSTGLLDTASEWLEAAVSKYKLDKINSSSLTFNLSDALASLGRIAFKKKDQNRALKLFEKANELDPENIALYMEFVQHRFGRDVEVLPELNRDNVEPWRRKFYSMCQNSTNSTWLNLQRTVLPQLKCRLRVSKTVPYLVYKEEILSKSPYISVISDLVSPREAEGIKNETLHLLKDVVLPGFNPYILWYYKANYFRDSYIPNIKRFSHRASDVTGLDVTQKNDANFQGEPAHVIDFGISGLILPHEEVKMKYSERYGRVGTGRFATLHVFLSNVTAGGAVVFIEQNITVIPKLGSAILWYNYKPSGEPEPNLLTATCPLATGQNIVLEKGIWLAPNDRNAFCGRRKRATFVTSDRVQTCHPSLCR